MSDEALSFSGEESDGSEIREVVIGPETCIFSGFLMKKGKFKWKRRWTVLQASRLLYYKDEKEYELLGIIEFKDVVALSKVEKIRSFVFALVTKSKTFYLQAPDESHFDHWMGSLRDCLNLEISLIQQSDLESDFDLPNDSMVESKSLDIVLKSGYLKKQSSSLGKPFKKRWFVLRKNGLLTIYKNSGEYVAQAVIDLKSTVAILDIDQISKSHPFCYKIIDLSGTEIIVSCSSLEERSEWIKILLQERTQGK
jgi:hypothetical protein